ncbi:MAG: alanine--tRNA ligase, partial [Actinobacteria bacterium]|nr:alanine--tRNA ligase [Actinomycetota bacterium]
TIRRIAAGFKAPAAEVETKISEALEEVKRAQKLLADATSKAAMALIPELLASATEISGTKLVAASVGELAPDSLRELILQLRERMGGNAVVILGASASDRATVMVAAGADAVASGKDSGVLGGGGGGKKDLAQGGGPELTKLEQAIAEAKALL